MKRLRIEARAIIRTVFSAICAIIALTASSAWSAVTLKQVQALENGRIEIVFDGKIQKSQIQTDFFGDTIQLTFRDAGIYPAKISNLNGHTVSKVFAYQYAPRVVRCRFTIKGKAEDFRSGLQVSASGKTVEVLLDRSASPQQDAVKASSAHPAETASEQELDASDRELQEKITAPDQSLHKTSGAGGQKGEALATGKPLGNPYSVFGKLMLVLAAFVTLAFIARQWLSAKGGVNTSQLSSRLGRGLGRLAKLKSDNPIEVMASHYLGPKKSIAVVKVGGRKLVLGVTDESINLITQIGETDIEGVDLETDAVLDQLTQSKAGERAQERAMAGAEQGGGFDRALSQASVAPRTAGAKMPSSVRSQIRSRLEGLKQL